MDRIINVKVAGSHLTKDSKNAGTRGEANITKLRINFDGGWNDFDKKIIFLDARGLNPVVIYLLPNLAESDTTYLVPIPGEPMAIAGELTFVIEGTLDNMVQKSLADTLVVKDSPDTSNASEPVKPTEDELAQLRHGIEDIKGDIVKAVDAKEDAERFAKQAETHSEQALTAVGKSSYIGEDGYWYAWSTVEKKYYCTNVKAQAGASVYMGDNPPADADIWIDPNGKAPKVGSNWAENNENHPRHVENRTHYVEGKLYGEVHFTKEETAAGDGYADIRLTEPLEIGKEYPYETNKGSGTLVLVQYGDIVYADVMGYNMEYHEDGDAAYFLVTVGYDVEGYIIIGQKPVYHPLAEGFIPEGIARKSYVDKAIQEIMNLNRTHYDAKLLIGEFTTSTAPGEMQLSEGFYPDREYILEIDGKEEKITYEYGSDGSWSLRTTGRELMYSFGGDNMYVQPTSTPQEYKFYRVEVVPLPEKYIPDSIARKTDIPEGGNYETEIADIEIITNGFKATFKTPLDNGMQLYYDYMAGRKPAKGMAKPIKINGDGKLEVSIGDKHHTDFALKGIADVGSNTMTFSLIENVDYPVYVKELSIPTPIPFKFLGISTGVNLGFNSEIKENSLNSNNFGSSNSIEGEHNNTFGTGHTIKGKASTITGQNGTIEGNLDFLGGDRGNITGRCDFGYGTDVFMIGQNSGAIGYGLRSIGNNQFVAGQYNADDADAFLIIGSGEGESSRQNAFVVKKDGSVYINNVKLIKLTQSDKDKIDSFYSSGFDNTTLNSNAVVQLGAKNINSVENTVQIGRDNNTAGSAGGYIYQIGYGNKSLSGQNYLIGKKLYSNEYEQIVVGKFNENVNNAIFVVGNGTSESDRKNAMVIDKYNDVKFSGRVKASAITLVSPNGTEFDVAINDDGTFRIT